MSNGKKKADNNAKNGNAYLAWAFVEAAHFAIRHYPEAKRFYDRKAAKTNSIVAIKALETGIVPPVPNYKEPDPELGELNLSRGGAYPVRHALRLAAGFGEKRAFDALG